MDAFGFLLIWLGGLIATVVVLVALSLRKPLLAVTQAPPEAVLRDLAFRLRATGRTVKETPKGLEVPVTSVALLKLRARATPRGTELRYEVDATGLGWTIVFILAGFSYTFVAGLAVALYVHVTAAGFARQHVAPLLAAAPLGTPPPPTVRALLLEGLSEAHRLASEAADYEREAIQNSIGIILLASLGVFSVVFALFGFVTPLPPPNGFPIAVGAALGASLTTAIAGPLLVHNRAAPRIRELEQESSLFEAAGTAELLGFSPPGAPRPGLELLLRAAERSSYWREVRRRRKVWHDPIAGLGIFLFGYGAFIFSILAGADFLPLPWRLALAALAITFAAGAFESARRWRRQMREEDERDRRSWEARRNALETELWRILSG